MAFDKIREIIVEQLKVDIDSVTMNTDLLKDLEADSLDAAEILVAIEEEYDIEIPEEKADKFQKIALPSYCSRNVRKIATGLRRYVPTVSKTAILFRLTLKSHDRSHW